MSRPVISVITRPVPSGRWLVQGLASRLGSRVFRLLRPPPAHARHLARLGGHPAVTRSLVHGLSQLGIPFSHNPRSIRRLARTVIVLSGRHTLAQALDWKRQGLIERLAAGPNLVVLPSDEPLLSSAGIDFVLTPAKWTCELYCREQSDLAGRCMAWAAGVDTEFWQSRAEKTGRIVVFRKGYAGIRPFAQELIRMLRSEGREVLEITYGHYDPSSYRNALRGALCLVGLSDSESQGIAWAEAWAMDVPTFIERHDLVRLRGKEYPCSSAPYLTPKTGSFFRTMEELGALISSVEAGSSLYSPRAWTCRHMSDVSSANELLNLIFNRDA